MESDLKPYIDPGHQLGFYADRVYCHCPKCDGKAVSIATNERWRIYCLSCTYQAQIASDKLYGTVVFDRHQQHCPTCGYQPLCAKIQPKVKNIPPKTQSVTCPNCKQQALLNVHSYTHLGAPIDPYFGLPLWLQTQCCGNVLWAYNEQHLSMLQSYIRSRLRDGRNRSKWSIISRLPRWMTSAKNRDTVLNCFDKLEKLRNED
jgi:ribosomal protein S27AE